jgi:signal transduction histidine kinase
MAHPDGRVHLLRLRLGMASIAVLQTLFWLGRDASHPGEVQAVAMRLAILAGAAVFFAASFLPVARRIGQALVLVALPLLVVSHTWVALAQGMSLDYVLPPVILFFAIGAIAANALEMATIAVATVLLPIALTLLHGWRAGEPPLVPLLLLLSAAVGGTVVSWFRLRSQATLTREIERRKLVETELRAARAHLESILNATSDGLCGVRYGADGPRITFANRRFGEIFGVDPQGLVGRLDAELRPAARRLFRDPERYERDAERAYANPAEVHTVEIELVRPRRAVLERWTGPIVDPQGAMVGRMWAFRDVTAQRASERERAAYAARLEATNADLARASRAKDAFLANLSHELRTPLSVIIGYLNLALEGDLGPEEIRQFLERSVASATHLLRLISDMLDVTRLEAGAAELRLEPLAVLPVLEEVHGIAHVLATAKRLELRVVADPAVWVLADRQRLRQVLLNLVGNAVKFTARGRVTVSAAAEDDRVRFVVRDTGRGVPLEQQALLFRKFVRLDPHATALEEGVGLGLAICRELVGLMGGEIALESAGPGHGTEVRFTLPRAAGASARAGGPAPEPGV